MGFWRKDNVHEHAREILRHVRHYRRMREDLMAATDLAALRMREAALAHALGEGPGDAITEAAEEVQTWLGRNAPRRRFPGLRENLEILAVAVGVAMACRTYFIQPFKIPTGSMQPTLHGIQYEARDGATLMDRFPFKIAKWLVLGEWYMDVKTSQAGYAIPTMDAADISSGHLSIIVGNKRYRIPAQAGPRIVPNEFLPKGSVLWRGVRVAGDHVFVDRVRWNLFPPRRGQITVFNTDNIPTLPDKTHYIKRMVGLPGERVSIIPPELLIDGVPVHEPEGIDRIQRRDTGFAGYQLVDIRTDGEPQAWAMRRTTDSITLGPDQFFALGDNTQNSRDGRYWGYVPRKNLVGPAAFVYWPFSRRWGVPQ